MPPFPPGFPSPKDFASLSSPRPDFPLHGMLGAQGRPYARSPPPMVCPNDPAANDCKIVDYRGEKIAAFMIGHKTMLCLPQVFELFLKNLVGGLHTVYTKCKRLELTPMICNVEQVSKREWEKKKRRNIERNFKEKSEKKRAIAGASASRPWRNPAGSESLQVDRGLRLRHPLQRLHHQSVSTNLLLTRRRNFKIRAEKLVPHTLET